MNEHVLEEHFCLKEAIIDLKNRLTEIDTKNHKNRDWYKEHMPDKLKNETMEEENWNDRLFLVYRNDYYEDTFYLFESEYSIENWLNKKWTDWDIWDYSDPNNFFEDTLVIWEFHRNVCKENWSTLYSESKSFIDGWSRKREFASMEYLPTFSIN